VSDFKEKVALVTGASRGIGASEVRLIAAKGARVLATDILDDLGAALAKEISASGATAAYVHLDATRTADWAQAVERALEMFGQPLLKNAAIKAAAADPDLSPLDFLLNLMRQRDLPLEFRVIVAQQALPFAHSKAKPGAFQFGAPFSSAKVTSSSASCCRTRFVNCHSAT
jgi:NAD(P)-dependent dehydrogenase (short-subunit alcohol dehydrogenase family)